MKLNFLRLIFLLSLLCVSNAYSLFGLGSGKATDELLTMVESLIKEETPIDMNRLKDVIERGADPNAENQGASAFFWIVLDDPNEEAALLLLDAGADPNLQNGNKKYTPLLAAAISDKENVAAKLIELKADPNSKTDERFWETVLYHAAKHNSLKVAKVLLDAGADPDLFSGSSLAPIVSAVTHGYAEMVSLLLDAGAAPDVVSSSMRYYPLALAIKGNHLHIAEMLMGAGAGPDLIVHEERISPSTLLLSFALDENEDVVKLLLDYGADPDIRHPSYDTLLLRDSYGDAECNKIFDFLQSMGVDIQDNRWSRRSAEYREIVVLIVMGILGLMAVAAFLWMLYSFYYKES